MATKNVRIFHIVGDLSTRSAIKVQFLVELANRDVSGFVDKIFSVGHIFTIMCLQNKFA